VFVLPKKGLHVSHANQFAVLAETTKVFAQEETGATKMSFVPTWNETQLTGGYRSRGPIELLKDVSTAYPDIAGPLKRLRSPGARLFPVGMS